MRFVVIVQCGSGAKPGTLSVGAAGTAWARCTSSSREATADDGIGREAEEGEASFCIGQPWQGTLQSGQGVHSMKHFNIASTHKY